MDFPHKHWEKCHGYSNTVVIVKVKGTDEIIGGYNPLAWDNGIIGQTSKWSQTNVSFIFSLKNGNIQNSILSRVKNFKYAILNTRKTKQHEYGPCFGIDFWTYTQKSYFSLDNESF